MQNKHDIQNQHQKLHRITYILSKNIFRQNSTHGGPQCKIEQKRAEGEYGSNVDEQHSLIKYMLFDAVFYADSEYHVYFA